MPELRVSNTDLCEMVQDARRRVGASAFWRRRDEGGCHVVVGVTLLSPDLTPLVRHYPHGKTGFEFSSPIEEFLERHEPTSPPLWTGVPGA